MEKHLVVGRGNLGMDLAIKIREKGFDLRHWTLSRTEEGFRPADARGSYFLPLEAALHDFDHIWFAVGAGSVDAAKEDFRPFARLHIELPLYLAQKADVKTKVHLFSTEYLCNADAAHWSKSLYAFSKSAMERGVSELSKEQRDRTYIWRIGSLYGVHRPLQTFPGKILRRLEDDSDPIVLPPNECIPTPTEWLAEHLIKQRGSMNLSPRWVRPAAVATPYEWAKMAFGSKWHRFELGAKDENRPAQLHHIGNFGDEWFLLWAAYGPAVLKAAEAELAKSKSAGG